ncbi:MAG TPA: hypothetical protein DDW67_01215 [Elusimicrobia bacterium]|jgi:hypothetical protein|nr:hypothetical protein [Elusimicrobiota bacterium]
MENVDNLSKDKKNPGHFERENTLNLVWVLGLPLMLLPVAVIMPNVLRHPAGSGLISVVLCVIGFALFSLAKFSQFRQGRYFTFGSAGMSPRDRILYRCGYALMAFAAVIALCLLFAAKV